VNVVALEEMTAPMLPPEEAARANTYTLLGALLARPPVGDILDLLRDINVDDLRSDCADEYDMVAAWAVLKLAAERSRPESIAEEFHELFIGLGRGELVPYGSWYLTGFLMEKPLGMLRRDLSRLGFERDENIREPEDHVAALCETMGLMIGMGDELDFQEQQAFFAAHVEPWMGKFFRDLRNAGAAGFYAAVGEFGDRFMDLEQRYFSMLV
jgi:TorA maturation chaperone TorD